MHPKKLVRLIYFIAPKHFRKRAMHRLSHPRNKTKIRPAEATVINQARRSTRSFGHFEIAGYKWGFGPKKALLIHGWEGRASNFAALIPLLVDHGYTVCAFDAPSHGESSTGESSLRDYADLIDEILKEGPYELMISHSFGAVPLTYALSRADGVPVNRLMFITSPDRFSDRVKQIVKELGLPEKAESDLMDDFETVSGLKVETLSVSQFCNNIYPQHAKILHGSNDLHLPIEWSRQVAAKLPNCRLIEIPDTGHYRILWHEDTQRELLDLILSESN